jgi:hypothetical protein
MKLKKNITSESFMFNKKSEELKKTDITSESVTLGKNSQPDTEKSARPKTGNYLAILSKKNKVGDFQQKTK